MVNNGKVARVPPFSSLRSYAQLSALSPMHRLTGALAVLLAVVIPQLLHFRSRMRAAEAEAELERQANAVSLARQKEVCDACVHMWSYAHR